MAKVKKAIILTGGYGIRFLPLSKVIPKDFFPLIDQPMIYYILQEVKNSGIEEVIVINTPHNGMLMDYLTPNYRLESFLQRRNKNEEIKILQQPQKLIDNLKITYIIQMEEPKGDGYAVLQAEKIVGQEPCAVLFSDDIVDCTPSEQPNLETEKTSSHNQKYCLSQLIEIYEQYRRPVFAIHQIPKEKICDYGVIEGQTYLDNKRLYKIKNFVEKPKKPEDAPSNLAVVGKYIITPEVIEELHKIKFDVSKDGIRLAYAFENLIKQQQTILGYQFEGKWLECGNKLLWLKSHLYLLLKHSVYKKEIKQYLQDNQLI